MPLLIIHFPGKALMALCGETKRLGASPSTLKLPPPERFVAVHLFQHGVDWMAFVIQNMNVSLS